MFENDIAPELLLKIQQTFQASIEQNMRIKELYRLLELRKATYQEANEYALLVGEALADAFKKHVRSDALPNGRMYYNIAERILKSTLGHNHELIADYSVEVQKAINKKSQIGIQVQRPKVNEDRINGIIDRVSNEENFDDVAWILNEPVINFSQSVVDEVVRANADFQYQSGLEPIIIRRMAGNCCEWCANLAGTYDYRDVKDTGNDVFRRHRFCRCTVEYDARDGSAKRNVHTHRDSGTDDDVEARKRLYEKQVAQMEKDNERQRKERIARAKQAEEERKLADKERRERLIKESMKG
jgi:hypothetical protein